jgi:ADP-dependent NAD(P)H-hydrate dehydratase / NAD(P)H-hydrate epimerase
MLAVVGTIPDKNFPLVSGEAVLQNDKMHVQGHSFAINRGTPALIASVFKILEFMKKPLPFVYLVGDTGLGEGSRRLYKFLTDHLRTSQFSTMAFHYLQPDVDWCNRIMFAIEEMQSRPVIIADAGFMYMAKMSGNAPIIDLFTPDAGELAFLADEDAPHPFYTRGFILHEDNKVPDLIVRAYANNNAARYLLVKGAQDYVSDREKILATIDSPMVESMEAIGGTGDTLTGIVTGLIASGMEIKDAAIIAAKVNRLAGYYAAPTPATQVLEIIEQIPRALREILN